MLGQARRGIAQHDWALYDVGKGADRERVGVVGTRGDNYRVGRGLALTKNFETRLVARGTVKPNGIASAEAFCRSNHGVAYGRGAANNINGRRCELFDGGRGLVG